MAQFMLSVWHDELFVPDFESEDFHRIGPKVDAWNERAIADGIFVFAGGLQAPSSATVVRASADGALSMTDGPFAETKEMLGGFWVIDVPDFDTALAWAKTATVACEQPIEVRPFHVGG